MSKPTVDTLIWRAIGEFSESDKFLTFEQKSKLSIRINEILESEQQSTPDFDRLMALENEVLRHGGQLKTLDDLDLDVSLVMDKWISTEKRLDVVEEKIGDIDSCASLDKYLSQQGQIAELTEQVKTLHEKYNRQNNEHQKLKSCIEEFVTNVYLKLM